MRPYRNPALLATAKGQDCMLRIPDVCNGNPETVVACHSNLSLHGKGMGIKAHDFCIAYGCSECHYWLDFGNASREEKELAFYRGMSRTLEHLFNEGILG
jgi:hypothetical protein